MDPVTQGVLGAAAAQAVAGRALPRSAWLIGVAAGMAADLDVFVNPPSDPLGGWSYHRQFTHSLVFIPIGALLSALPFLFWRAYRGRRRWVLGAALAAYATHAPLDACTSWGTMLLWPLSDVRISWDLIGIIDPLFTLVLLAGVIMAAARRRPKFAGAALGLAAAYLGLGFVQHQRARHAQEALASARGHLIERSRVMPAPLTLLVWRSVYEADGWLHADTLRVGLPGHTTVMEGGSTPRLTLDALERSRPLTDAQRAAFRAIEWFADGYVAWDSAMPDVVGDMRYGDPDRFASLWGMYLPPPGSPEPPRMTWRPRDQRESRTAWLWEAIRGEGQTPLPLAHPE